ncbi:putative transferase [Helianthus debilis subsp. tardiflorus]
MVKDEPVDSSGQVIYTKGYGDPEYIKTGHFTKSSNIYSFCVVLLELLTGQRCVDKNGPEGERILVEFAKPFPNSNGACKECNGNKYDFAGFNSWQRRRLHAY